MGMGKNRYTALAVHAHCRIRTRNTDCGSPASDTAHANSSIQPASDTAHANTSIPPASYTVQTNIGISPASDTQSAQTPAFPQTLLPTSLHQFVPPNPPLFVLMKLLTAQSDQKHEIRTLLLATDEKTVSNISAKSMALK